ncbi:AcrR family transcriptional regulator [Streptomyces sp. LBL]|uniref:TetR/AcrR family transcriptional regulator n=1 Tax=Streptomyces sp. LBL TaxID=2940562 RepID=UPI0024768190|nr:TetR family transcriptional regulator [Streptomyces sp. LBL]MDH6628639.1 AcrR family transcriptional regulator [Streptomyces sp. LBL]
MAEPRLRRDAERNRQRLLDAGRELFAARGIDATLNDVARHAGVGVGTAYRRFANKEELIDAIYEQQVTEIEEILRDALIEPDAWRGLVAYLECALKLQAGDRAMAQILSGRRVASEQYDWSRDRLAPLVNALVERAREQGVVRPDLTGTDLILVEIGLTAIATFVCDGAGSIDRDDIGELYRRYLGIFLDGLRPDTPSPLPIAALTTDEAHAVLRQRD